MYKTWTLILVVIIIVKLLLCFVFRGVGQNQQSEKPKHETKLSYDFSDENSQQAPADIHLMIDVSAQKGRFFFLPGGTSKPEVSHHHSVSLWLCQYFKGRLNRALEALHFVQDHLDGSNRRNRVCEAEAGGEKGTSEASALR